MHARKEGEEQLMGKHIYGKGLHYLEHHNAASSEENRSMFIEFCASENLVIKNTMFQKPKHKLITYKEIGTEIFEAPWGPEHNKYAQLDYFSFITDGKT